MKQSKKVQRRLAERQARDESVYGSKEWQAATKRPKPPARGWQNWGQR